MKNYHHIDGKRVQVGRVLGLADAEVHIAARRSASTGSFRHRQPGRRRRSRLILHQDKAQ